MAETQAIRCTAVRLFFAAALSFAGGSALAGEAGATVTETPGRVVLENDSVRLAFDAENNWVPCELVYAKGSGENLIVNNFCLYYQYVEAGGIRSVHEGYPGGQVVNGRHTVARGAGGSATLEFRGDTPHFRLTRRVTVPATGADIRFEYELEVTTRAILEFSLPYAALSAKLNRRVTLGERIESDGRRIERPVVDEVDSPVLPTRSPYGQTACFFSEQTGEGVVFAQVPEESAAGIRGCPTPEVPIGARERCTFILAPFRGEPEAALASFTRPRGVPDEDVSRTSSAVVLTRTARAVLWADHATRRIFPREPVPGAAPGGGEVAIEAAQGECEPFQIVVSPEKELPDVRLVPTPLLGDAGARLEAASIRYHPIGSLRSSRGEEIPDLLLHEASAACPAGENTVFLVTVKVPLGTPPGIYRGRIAVVSPDEPLGDVALRLRVRNFALAPMPRIRAFATDYVYYHDGPVDLNDEAAVRAGFRRAAATEEEIEAYADRMRFFTEHRLYETHFGPRPNYSGAVRIDWQRRADGGYDLNGIDFAGFDKARRFCYEELHWPRFAYDPELMPYLGFINQYTFGGKDGEHYWYMKYWDPVLPRSDPGAAPGSIYDLSRDFTPEFKEKLLRYVRTIADHCRAEGIGIDENGNGPVLFLADEIPDFSSGHAVVTKTLELARLIRAADPRIVLVVNGRDVPDDPAILDLFDLWTARCPPERLARLRAMGKRYGDYYMHGYFNLRGEAIDPRIQFWSYWGTGFFWIGSWAMTLDPEQSRYGTRRDYANNWWFPSTQSPYGEPVSTIRFEMMREGLEDHEYLCMLRDRATRAAAAGDVDPDLLARAESLLRRAEAAGGTYTCSGGEYFFRRYLRDPVRLLDLRREIGDVLEALPEEAPPPGPPGE